MEIVILLYNGFTALDVVGPYEVLNRLPSATIKFAARERGMIESEYPALKMIATHSLEEIESADILMIPGSTTGFLNAMKDPEILEQVRRIDQTTEWTISVCTGSIILAAAGLLKGTPATSHWAALEKLAKLGATPVTGRYVHSGKFMTSAGVSAGIDMALYLTGLIEGDGYSNMVQTVIEYFPEPPTGRSAFSEIAEQVKTAASVFLRKHMAEAGMLPS